MKLLTEAITRARALADCRVVATAGEKWLSKAREYYYHLPGPNGLTEN